jgi:hypothetical protein
MEAWFCLACVRSGVQTPIPMRWGGRKGKMEGGKEGMKGRRDREEEGGSREGGIEREYYHFE